MRPWFEIVTDLDEDREVLRRRRYGVIEAADGQLRQVLLRPFPKVVSAPGILLFGAWRHEHCAADRCLLYYNQSWRFSNYLGLIYVVSGRRTSFGTVCRALETLDRIAEIKRTDALLCDVANWRLTPRILARWGWEPHCPSRWHRNYIKRFYGEYPSATPSDRPQSPQAWHKCRG
jgi:hypothetical protein